MQREKLVASQEEEEAEYHKHLPANKADDNQAEHDKVCG